MKRFWLAKLFLLCNVIVAGLQVLNFSGWHQVATAQTSTTGNSLSNPQHNYTQLETLVQKVNQQRSNIGAPQLVHDPELDVIAEKRAQVMANHAYSEHEPLGTESSYICANQSMAETFLVDSILDSWLSSTSGDKECLLNQSTLKVGYATTKVLVSNGMPVNQTIVVAIYSVQ